MAIIEVHGQGGNALQLAVDSAAEAGDTIQVWGDPALPYSVITVSKNLTIVGMNGRDNCVIDGGHTYNEETDTHTGTKCVNGATRTKHTIKSFTLQNGGVDGTSYGGCADTFTLDDCVIKNGYAARGGGAYNCVIYNSIIEGCVATKYGGGANSCNITNSIIRNNTATDRGGGTYYGTITDCEIYDNTATDRGGGTYGGTITGCEIYGNTATNGGGTYNGTITECKIYNNTATNGGGTHSGKITDCEIYGNTATNYGGGTYGGTITGCEIYGNTVTNYGGGCNNSTVTNCKIYDNTAKYGGGTHSGTITGCEIYDNTATDHGGGTYNTTTTNCYIHDNYASTNDYDSVYNGTHINDLIVGGGRGNYYSCTIISDKGFCVNLYSYSIRNCILYFKGENGTPIKDNNVDRVSHCLFYPAIDGATNEGILNGVDPLLTPDYHLHKRSPCIGTGSAEYLQSATDLDGKEWKVPPSIGCYEFSENRKLPSDMFPLGK